MFPAIVDMATFEKAQRTLESNVQHKERRGIYTGKTDFAGKLVVRLLQAHITFLLVATISSRWAAGYGHTHARQSVTMSRDKDGNRVMLCSNPNVSETKINHYMQKQGHSITVCSSGFLEVWKN